MAGAGDGAREAKAAIAGRAAKGVGTRQPKRFARRDAGGYAASVMTDFVTIGQFITREEAAIACGLLEAEGIAAVVPEFHQFTAMPHIGFGEGFRLQVSADEEERAKAILSDAQLSAMRNAQ